MPKPIWSGENNGAISDADEPKPSLLKTGGCFAGILIVPDADDEETFLKNAAKIWRRAHPIKRGRRSVEHLVFMECFCLRDMGKIDENTSLEKIVGAITNIPEDWKRKYRRKIPYDSTILKHVRQWRKRTRAMLAKGHSIEETRKALLGVKPLRPYNPWGARFFPRKK